MDKTQGIGDLKIANGSVGVELILFAAELLAVGLADLLCARHPPSVTPSHSRLNKLTVSLAGNEHFTAAC